MSELHQWQLQDAKNRFSELVKLAQSAPQTVTVHGRPSAVILSYIDYQTMTQPKQSLLDVMRSAPKGFVDMDIARVRDTEMRDVSI